MYITIWLVLGTTDYYMYVQSCHKQWKSGAAPLYFSVFSFDVVQKMQQNLKNSFDLLTSTTLLYCSAENPAYMYMYVHALRYMYSPVVKGVVQ